MNLANYLLVYLATHPSVTVRFYASDTILNIHLDELYMHIAAGHFFLDILPKDNEPIFLNGAFQVLCTIIPFVTASAVHFISKHQRGPYLLT